MRAHGDRFGLFGPRYSIDDERVTIVQTRLALLIPIAFVGGLVLAGIGFVELRHERRVEANAAQIVGVVVFILGMLSAVGHGSGQPPRVVFSRGGIEWGAEHHAVAEVHSIRIAPPVRDDGIFRPAIVIGLAGGDRLLVLNDLWLRRSRLEPRVREIRNNVARVLGVGD